MTEDKCGMKKMDYCKTVIVTKRGAISDIQSLVVDIAAPLGGAIRSLIASSVSYKLAEMEIYLWNYSLWNQKSPEVRFVLSKLPKEYDIIQINKSGRVKGSVKCFGLLGAAIYIEKGVVFDRCKMAIHAERGLNCHIATFAEDLPEDEQDTVLSLLAQPVYHDVGKGTGTEIYFWDHSSWNQESREAQFILSKLPKKTDILQFSETGEVKGSVNKFGLLTVGMCIDKGIVVL